MASKMEYKPESPYKTDSPLSYDVEEGELSSGSERSSPGTIRDNASECSTQTNEYVEAVTSMRVEVDNSTDEQHTRTGSSQQTPQEIARTIVEKTVKPKTTDVRKNFESSRTRNNNERTEEQTTDKHSYQNYRPQNNNSKPSETYTSPPMPNYPPPVRPPPHEDYTTYSHRMQHRVQQR